MHERLDRNPKHRSTQHRRRHLPISSFCTTPLHRQSPLPPSSKSAIVFLNAGPVNHRQARADSLRAQYLIRQHGSHAQQRVSLRYPISQHRTQVSHLYDLRAPPAPPSGVAVSGRVVGAASRELARIRDYRVAKSDLMLSRRVPSLKAPCICHLRHIRSRAARAPRNQRAFR